MYYLRKKECKSLEHLFNIVAERAKSNVGVKDFKGPDKHNIVLGLLI